MLEPGGAMTGGARSRPFLFFPELAIAIALAIGFFKIYGRMTRPDVPRPIELAVSRFAPGVALGKPVADGAMRLGDLTWVRDVGFVGGSRTGFAQTRLLLSPEDRAAQVGSRAANVDAVELVMTNDDARSAISDLSML